MLDKILEYEKRLLDDREQLRKLMEEAGDNSELAQDKLRFFKAELAYMNKQLEILSGTQSETTVKQVAQQIPPVQQVPLMQQVPPVQQMPPVAMYQQPYVAQPMKKNDDFEKKFGKTFMGIVASVLIFISIILFATLLIPSLDDTIKMIVTFVVSFAICGIGWFKLHRNPQDKFFLALTGCGMGALYISLILSNMYFKMVGDVLLYVFIAVWAVGICVLSRYNNLVFQIIGHIGIVISMFFGTVLCTETEDSGKFIILIVFYIITSVVLYMTHFKRRFNDNICAHIANIISLFIIFLGYVDLFDRGDFAYGIIIVFLLAHIVVCFVCKWKSNEFAPGLVLSLYTVQLVLFEIGLVTADFWQEFLIYIIAMAVCLTIEFVRKGKDSSKTFLQVITIIIAFIAVSLIEVLHLHGVVPLVIIPFLAMGFWRSNSTYKCAALVITYQYVLFERDINEFEWFVLGFLVVAALYMLVYVCEKQYSVVYKAFVHVLGVLLWLIPCGNIAELVFEDSELSLSVTYIIMAIFNLCIMYSPFSCNVATGQKEKRTLFYVINAFMMIMGLGCIHYDLNVIVHIMLVIVTLGLFMVNSKNMLDMYPNGFGGAYVGIKLTVFMLVLLSAYDATDYVVSIGCFVFAVASIVVGFVAKYKSLRVYGLVLCMVSVFKLIVVDIEYADTLGYAISFFVAGVLCFAISLLYNYVDKRFKENAVPQGNVPPNNMMR